MGVEVNPGINVPQGSVAGREKRSVGEEGNKVGITLLSIAEI